MAGLGAPPFAPPLPADTQPGAAVAFALETSLTVTSGGPSRAGSATFGLATTLTVGVGAPQRGQAVNLDRELTLTPVGVKKSGSGVVQALLIDFVQGPLVGRAIFNRSLTIGSVISGRGPRRRGNLANRITAWTDGPAVRKVPEYLRRR